MTGMGRMRTSCCFLLAALSCLLWAPAASPQVTTAPASATPASASSSKPSTFKVRQDILLQQQAALEAQIRVASLCIADASKPQLLRDPEGNVNAVPQKDIINCTRQLKTLTRQLANVARQLQKLAADAEAAAAQLQKKQDIAQRTQRTQWVNRGER